MFEGPRPSLGAPSRRKPRLIDEHGRHRLYLALEEHLGEQEADTLMELLPPVGWADVATKTDLRALEERLDLRFEAIEHHFASKADLAALQRSMLAMMIGMLFTVTAILLTAITLTR